MKFQNWPYTTVIFVRSRGFFENVKVEKWLKSYWQMLLMVNILFDGRNHKQNNLGKYWTHSDDINWLCFSTSQTHIISILESISIKSHTKILHFKIVIKKSVVKFGNRNFKCIEDLLGKGFMIETFSVTLPGAPEITLPYARGIKWWDCSRGFIRGLR